jgi:hypothetical protein
VLTAIALWEVYLRVTKTMALLVLSLLLFAVACGDDDSAPSSSGASSSSGSSDATTPSAAAGNDGGGAPSTSDAALGDDTATVTIGDQTWTFDVSTLCLSAFGAFGADGKAADGSDVDVNVSLPPNDWETRSDSADWDPPSVRLGDDENDLDWVAGGDVITALTGVTPEMSQVTSFMIDGSTASGTAVFVESYAVLKGEAPQPVEGSFAVSCDCDPYS